MFVIVLCNSNIIVIIIDSYQDVYHDFKTTDCRKKMKKFWISFTQLYREDFHNMVAGTLGGVGIYV